VELAETTLDRPLLDEMATAAGGKVVAPAEVASLLPLFLTEAGSREEIRETPLWDNAIVFAVLALLLTSEWWLRRKSGLPETPLFPVIVRSNRRWTQMNADNQNVICKVASRVGWFLFHKTL
jgi:hypothetical protein